MSSMRRTALTHELVTPFRMHKNEPEWMLDFRPGAHDIFARPMPDLGRGPLAGSISTNIYYYLKPSEKQAEKWDERPRGIWTPGPARHPRGREQKYLAGVGAQYESARSSITTSRRDLEARA